MSEKRKVKRGKENTNVIFSKQLVELVACPGLVCLAGSHGLLQGGHFGDAMGQQLGDVEGRVA